MKKTRLVAVSGGFDPIHVGHVRMFQAARKLGTKLVVILNNDNWLRNKKGFVFMPEKERMELLKSFPFVDRVVLTDHKPQDADRSVVRALRKIKPDVFANGGDRTNTNTPEKSICKELGIRAVFNVGRGGKIQSSSWMIRDAARGLARSVRPWGEFYQWDRGSGWNLKTLTIKPGKRLSLQTHKKREEWWMLVEGEATATTMHRGKIVRTRLKKGVFFKVLRGMPHRIESKKGGSLIETAFGHFDESDITRLEDDYGRMG